ncbi:hypothetical protein ACO3UB_08445 (plasmid) [Methanocaldococcus sp. 16A]
MFEEDLPDKAMIAAKIHASLPPARGMPAPERGEFLTYIASSAEVPKDILNELWAFHNKDIATTRLNHDNILGLMNLQRAIKLMMLKDLPLSKFTEDNLRKLANLSASTYIRGMKSIGGFVVKKISETTDVKVLKREKDGLF